MNLFEMNDGMLIVSPEALGITVFNTLWTRDKTKTKKKALDEFSYIYFFCDFKSDFADLVNEKERHDAIVDSVIENKAWTPDPVVKAAMQLYLERSSTVTSTMLDDAKQAVSKISTFIRSVNLLERDKNDKPIHSAKGVAAVIKDMSGIIEGIAALEAKVKREQDEESTMKGNRKKSIFEDGI